MSIRTVRSGAEETSEKRTFAKTKQKTKQTRQHWRRSHVLSVVALLVSFVMCVCVMPIHRKLWQLSGVNVSCCSAVQAYVGSVIDVSRCCVQHGCCDFFTGCKKSPVHWLWKPNQWLKPWKHPLFPCRSIVKAWHFQGEVYMCYI